MNRREALDEICRALRDYGSAAEESAEKGATIYEADWAAALLNELLPQVTTVEELEALPKGAKLLGADGSTWMQHLEAWRSDTYSIRRSSTLLELKKANPLTVVWQP